MSDSLTLYRTLIDFVWQNEVRFHDLRCLITFVWVLVGLLLSQQIHLSQWAVYRPGRAKTGSKQRQLSRWLHNCKISPSQVYDPLIKRVLQGWANQRLYLALWVYRANQPRTKVGRLMPAKGQALFVHKVWLTEQRFGPVYLALAHVQTAAGYEQWAIVSDEPTDLQTLTEYGFRFDIEENFLDDKSAGFQLESSEIQQVEALARLLLILAVAWS